MLPGPEMARLSAFVVTKLPHAVKFGIVNSPDIVVGPPRFAFADMVTVTGVAVVHRLPTWG